MQVRFFFGKCFAYGSLLYSSSLTGSHHSVRGRLARDFDREMHKPAVLCRAVPVLYIGRDDNNVSRVRSRAACPPPDTSRGAGQSRIWPPPFRLMMDVPVVAAGRLKRHVADGNALGGEHVQIALADKILCEGGVLRAARKHCGSVKFRHT